MATTGGGSPETVFPEDLHVMGSELWRAVYAGANSGRGAKRLTSGPDTSITLVVVSAMLFTLKKKIWGVLDLLDTRRQQTVFARR